MLLLVVAQFLKNQYVSKGMYCADPQHCFHLESLEAQLEVWRRNIASIENLQNAQVPFAANMQ